MVVPDGFVLPSPAALAALLTLCAVVVALLVLLDPPVTRATVLALFPWMVLGGALHVLAVVDVVGPPVAPLLEAPAVYLTTFVLAGTVWIASTARAGARGSFRRVPLRLGTIGLAVGAVVVGLVLVVGIGRDTLSVRWPAVGLAASVVVTALAWWVVRRRYPAVAARTGLVGAVVVFSHVLDGVTTAVGIDVLGATERSPLPQLVMDAAALLPIADVVGVGWLFVAVKLALALFVVGTFAEYAAEQPSRAFPILGAIAAVGLGPGVHNLLLFAVAG